MLPAPLAPRDPAECLEGLLIALGRITELGVAIRFDHLDPADVGVYDGPTATVHFRPGAPIANLAWVATDMWQRLAIGITTSAKAQQPPRLYAVP